MRPIQLGLSALGPYLEAVQVDFRKLGAQQLFLIHGPIGSGKTTLLDAICFALYGASSGGERTAQNMRNDLAEESQPTTVIFDFSRGHAHYRVKRQLLGELRAAQLWNLTGTDLPDLWAEPVQEPMTTNEKGWDDVTALVSEMLGLGEGEFRRSILIPQGQFRELLSAAPAEREQILGAIFDSGSQHQIVPSLEKTIADQQEQLRLAWQKREDLAREMQLDSGEDVLERLDQQKKSLVHLEVEMIRLQQLQESIVVDAGKSAVFQERSQELAEAQKRLKQLEEKESRLEQQKESLSRYRAASLLGDYQSQLDQAEVDVGRAQDELDRALFMQQTPGGDADTPEKSLDDLRASQELHGELRADLQKLDDAARVVEAWEQACRDRDRQQQLVDQLKEQLEQLAEALRESQERLDGLGSSERGPTQAERIRALQEQIALLQRGQRRSQAQGDVRASADRLSQYLSKSEQRCQEMEGRVTTLEEEIARLQGTSFLAQALFLAAQLQPGQPCMVCGSPDHPQPAQGDLALTQPEAPRGLIDRSRERQSPERLLEQKTLQLKQARVLAKKLESERAEQALTLARLESRLETLQDETLESVAVPASSERTLAQLTEELRLLEREASGKGKEENEKLRMQQRLQKLGRTQTDLQAAFREAEIRLVQRSTQAEERELQLHPGLDTLEKIEASRAQILSDMEAVSKDMQGGQATLMQSTGEAAARQAAVQAAERGLEMARDRLRLAREVYEARSEAAGFASLDEVGESLSSFEGSPDQVLAQLQRHDQELASARDRVERASQLLTESHEEGSSVQDLESLRQRLDTLVSQKSDCQMQIQELQARSEEYQLCIEEINRLEPLLSQVKRLLRIAGGENRQKISFPQYLLSQHLENVLLAANHRLGMMTRGRYTLQAIGKGLQLEVRDHVSGQLRSLATLSGGESFLASLALALGLSDSLASGGQAGVEALFIDEGFGNLDEDALELAVQGLMSLQHEGRLVGVVSHLPELKERIPARLEVRAGPSGSRVQFSVHR